MTVDFAEQMKTEIAKVQDEEQRSFLEHILGYEVDNNLDIEHNPILSEALVTMIGMELTISKEKSKVWYQQYRTMKALLKKDKGAENGNTEIFEEN